MKNSVFAGLASVLLSFNATAIVCSKIDLRNEVLGEVHNQGSSGWCFAVTAADMISYKIGKKVSFADLSLSYFEKNWGLPSSNEAMKGFSHGGFVGIALNHARRNGICLEKDMPSDNFRAYGVVLPYSYSVTNVTWILDIMKNFKRTNQVQTYIQLPHVTKNEFIELVEQNTPRDAWVSIVNKSCEGRRIGVEDLNIKTPLFSKVSDGLSFKIIHKQLEAGNIVGISYSANFLNSIKSSGGHHASSVVGRRWNKKSNSCEFLIRNSWGRDCEQYDKTFECEQGNVWVPRPLLDEHLYYVNYIK